MTDDLDDRPISSYRQTVNKRTGRRGKRVCQLDNECLVCDGTAPATQRRLPAWHLCARHIGSGRPSCGCGWRTAENFSRRGGRGSSDDHQAIEIRDRNTFIPALAIAVTAANEEQRYLLRRAGYSVNGSTVILIKATDCKASCDPYEWHGARTMQNAHAWIEAHFAEITDGDVVDVEFILGESTAPKRSERFSAVIAGERHAMAHPLFRIIAALDNHFSADDVLLVDAARWRELKRHIVRMKDGLDLARIELESLERGAPQTKEIARKALQHVRFGLGEEGP